jgi:hypothetical protein
LASSALDGKIGKRIGALRVAQHANLLFWNIRGSFYHAKNRRCEVALRLISDPGTALDIRQQRCAFSRKRNANSAEDGSESHAGPKY